MNSQTSPHRPFNVVVTNAVLSNTGDAAIYQGILTSLAAEARISTQDVVVMDGDAKSVRPLYPQWKIEQQLTVPSTTASRASRLTERVIRQMLCTFVSYVPHQAPNVARLLDLLGRANMASSLRALINADVVISSGGTYLVDHYNFGPRITELRMAAALGAKIILWTQSLGPFETPEARQKIKRLTNKIDYAFLRDTPSYQALKRVLPQNIRAHVVPDVAFALGNSTPDGNQKTMHPHIIVSVREWSSPVNGPNFEFKNYENALRRFVETMTTRDTKVTALSTCQGVKTYKIDDSVLAKRIFKRLPVLVKDEHHTPDELIKELENGDLIVTTRMHMAILALAIGKPVIAIAYEFKTIELFRNLGLESNVCAIEDVTQQWLETHALQAIREPSAYQLSQAKRCSLAKDAMSPGQYVQQIFAELNITSPKAPIE